MDKRKTRFTMEVQIFQMEVTMQSKTVDIGYTVAVAYYLADMERRNLSAETIKDVT
jgi:hypothetical protein